MGVIGSGPVIPAGRGPGAISQGRGPGAHVQGLSTFAEGAQGAVSRVSWASAAGRNLCLGSWEM